LTPDQQRVYDAYPMLSSQLVQVTAAFTRLPLDDMLVAIDRVIFNGTVVGHAHGVGIDLDGARNQKRLIEAAIVFRKTLEPVGPQIVVPR
jgi:hypothetical protein